VGAVITLAELADGYEGLPAKMRDVAIRFPGARVVRNQVGNLAILSADGEYVGWIDVLMGEVEAFDQLG
jgi:hypothetical protein